MKQLVPAAEQLSPTLVSIAELAPEAKAFFGSLEKVNKLAPTGFPALRKLFRDEFPPLLQAFEPFVRNLNPILTGLDLYKANVAGAFANLSSTFLGELPTVDKNGNHLHYLRAIGPINAESLSTYGSRLTTNRNSAYSPPNWAELLKTGALPGFDTAQCSPVPRRRSNPNTPRKPGFKERVKLLEPAGRHRPNPGRNDQTERRTRSFYNGLRQYAFGGGSSTAESPAPACKQQGKFKPIYGNGPATSYQHTFEQRGKP